jgi:hypothetical protein
MNLHATLIRVLLAAPLPIRRYSHCFLSRNSATDNISRNPLRINTSNTPRKCSAEAAYNHPLSFRINTYKKTWGEGAIIVNQRSPGNSATDGMFSSLPSGASHPYTASSHPASLFRWNQIIHP